MATNYIILMFKSRNKDNKNVPNFTKRETFKVVPTSDIKVDYEEMYLEYRDEFYEFVTQGVTGETSRMYCSINVADGKKVSEKISHFALDFLLKCDIISLRDKLSAKIVRECMKKENKVKETRWMLDIDSEDDIKWVDKCFKDDPYMTDALVVWSSYTPNGKHVILRKPENQLEWAFINKIVQGGDDITLKKDDLYLLEAITKEE